LSKRRDGKRRKRTLRNNPMRIGTPPPELYPVAWMYEAWVPPEPRRYCPTERSIRAAVLERAVIDAELGDVGALRWIYGLDPSPPTYSCEDICDLLDMPVDRVRQRLMRPLWSDDDRPTPRRDLAQRSE
jgi:hypothetical protein